MDLDYTGVNWIAIIAAVAVSSVIGFIWFLPQVFGRRLATVSGRPFPQPGQTPPTTYLGALVVRLVIASVLALIVSGLGVGTLTDGAIVGFLVWLGFVATTSYAGVLWEGRPIASWAILAGNEVVGFVAMGAIIGYLG